MKHGTHSSLYIYRSSLSSEEHVIEVWWRFNFRFLAQLLKSACEFVFACSTWTFTSIILASFLLIIKQNIWTKMYLKWVSLIWKNNLRTNIISKMELLLWARKTCQISLFYLMEFQKLRRWLPLQVPVMKSLSTPWA